MTFLGELRSAALRCSDVLLRKLLQDAADELQTAIKDLHGAPTVENAQTFNAKWVHAYWLLERFYWCDPPPGGARAREAA